MKAIVIGIGILLLIASSYTFIKVFPILPICHSTHEQGVMNPRTPIFSPDGMKVGFIGYSYVYRPPVGICAFPDGGTNLDVKTEMQIYAVDTNTSLTSLVAKVPIKVMGSLEQDAYEIFGWEDNWVYFLVSDEYDGTNVVHYFKVNVDNGEYIEISQAEGAALRANYWGQMRFNPFNELEWVDYDSDTNTIGIFTGGKWRIDKERRSIGHSGYPKTELVKTLVDSATLESFQPALTK